MLTLSTNINNPSYNNNKSPFINFYNLYQQQINSFLNTNIQPIDFSPSSTLLFDLSITIQITYSLSTITITLIKPYQ